MITIRLRPMTAQAARERGPVALADVRVADGYPTEFSASVAEGVGDEGSVGPFFIHRRDDDAASRLIRTNPLRRVAERAKLADDERLS